MQYYYAQLFPFELVFKWLCHSETSTEAMDRREIAMAFRSGAYKRYNSFSDAHEFKQQIERANPDRFEIGAVYNNRPRDRDTLLKSELVALEKELVFDIDMDDYDDYRTCCSGAQICVKCWKFISLAIEVMDVTLRDDFGFQDMIWVFSGRRGAHCWVSDKRARQLNDIQRRNVLDYVNVVRDRNPERRSALKRPYHPHLTRSLNLLKPHFVDIILEEQDPWRDDEEAAKTLLSGFHDKRLVEMLKTFWLENKNRSSMDKWSDIDSQFTIMLSSLKPPKKKEMLARLKEWKEDMIIATLYPKLDVEVTKQVNHLLKSPFCIHPATGNVCVPITKDFVPSLAPKLIDLQEEIESKGSSINSTSLQPFIDHFKSFVDSVVKHESGAIKREAE